MPKAWETWSFSWSTDFQWKLESSTKFKVKKNQISVCSNQSWRLYEQSCDGLLSFPCTSWSASHVLALSSAHVFHLPHQNEKVVSTLQDCTAPVREVREQTGGRFSFIQMGCLSHALPCRKSRRKHRKFWGHLPCSWKSPSSEGDEVYVVQSWNSKTGTSGISPESYN